MREKLASFTGTSLILNFSFPSFCCKRAPRTKDGRVVHVLSTPSSVYVCLAVSDRKQDGDKFEESTSDFRCHA